MGTTKDIREAVKAELSFDPLVDDTAITVKNMNGDVALNGTVPSYPQYMEAGAAARRVQGVTSVHNHLMVILTPRRLPRRPDAHHHGQQRTRAQHHRARRCGS